MTMINRTNQPGDEVDPFPGVEARPLQLPDFSNIRHKNSAIAVRWVNRAVGVQQSTQRLDEMVFAGFVPCAPAECEIVTVNGPKPVPPNLIKDNKIIRGDLICMKIDKAAYDGALKYNWERAIQRLHPSRQLATGKQQLARAVSEKGVPRSVLPTLKSKLQAFRPGEGEKTADPNFMAEDDKLPSERKED